MRIGKEIIKEVGIPAGSGEDSNSELSPVRVVPRVIQGLPRAFQKHAVLRICQFGVSRGVSKQFAVEEFHALQQNTCFHVVRRLNQARLHPGGQELIIRKRSYGLYAGAQVLPELLDAGSVRKSPSHADNSDFVELISFRFHAQTIP
jgi:hypothetical protein